FRQVDKHLLTSDGTDIAQTLVHGASGMRAIATWKDDVQQRSHPMDHDGGCAARGYELVRALDLAGHAERVREEAIALCAAPVLPAGRTNVVLSTEQLALQIHESCGHPTESDRALGEEVSLAGRSFLTPDRLGRFRYGSALVNLTADARTPGGLGTQGWDDEGVPARRTPLVARGQFVGYLSSRETAGRLGLGRPAGCMRAESWNRPPIIRMINVSLEPPPAGPTLADLIADTRAGVLFGCNKSWSIDDLRLNFQFGCEAAWAIENGRPGRMYKNPIYTSSTPAFWGGRRHLRPLGVSHVGLFELRQGRPDAVHVGRARLRARAFPERRGARRMSPQGRLELLERALGVPGADEIEICFCGGRAGATRFANSQIVQSAVLEDPIVQVRAALGRRVGVARG